MYPLTLVGEEVVVVVNVLVRVQVLVTVGVVVDVCVAVGVGLEVRQGTANVTVEGIEFEPEFQTTDSKTLEF